ncbi:MAG: lamin tail domain-containing protein, partial [Eubacteriales bacterium]|nr:lamin tail domain-containing protein [Eubacteriales bacterium]
MKLKKTWLSLALVAFLCIASNAAAGIVISEVMASNGVYQNGQAYDWIELHNTGSETVALAGYTLSDKEERPGKWAFPDSAVLDGGGYLLVYCTG